MIVENSGDADSEEMDTDATNVTRRRRIWRRVRRICYTLLTIAIVGPLTAFARRSDT